MRSGVQNKRLRVQAARLAALHARACLELQLESELHGAWSADLVQAAEASISAAATEAGGSVSEEIPK